MSMFVRVHDSFGQEYAINVDNISWINAEMSCVCMSGVNHGNGILDLCREDINRLLAMTGVEDHGTD